MLKKIAVVALCTVGAVSASALAYAAVTSGPEGARDFFRTDCHSSYSGHMSRMGHAGHMNWMGFADCEDEAAHAMGHSGRRMYESRDAGPTPDWMMQEGIR